MFVQSERGIGRIRLFDNSKRADLLITKSVSSEFHFRVLSSNLVPASNVDTLDSLGPFQLLDYPRPRRGIGREVDDPSFVHCRLDALV